jgi:hypothetical protein
MSITDHTPTAAEVARATAWFRDNPFLIHEVKVGETDILSSHNAAVLVRAALAAAPAGPDDAHTETVVVRGRVTNVGDDTTSTLRHVEWLTIGTDEDGNEGAETFEAQLDAVAAATRWRIRGMTNVYVERHDVSTTRTVTLWEAQR